MALTVKQELFIALYLISGNATQAAIEAGYSKKTASSIGHKLVHQKDVAAEIGTRKAAQLERLQVTNDRLLEEAARIAFFNPKNFFHSDGRPKDISEIDDDTAAAIAGMDVFEEFARSGKNRIKIGEVRKWKLASKIDAIQLLMKHRGMLNDKVDHSGTVHIKAYVITDPDDIGTETADA